MENEKTCSECGCIIEGDAVMIDGEAYCADCAAEFVQCANCGEWIKRNESTTGPDGEAYCESCCDDLLFYCEECGCYEWAEDAVSVADNPYQRRRGNVRYLCRSCAERVAECCEDCGEWYTEGIYHIRDGYRCEDCGEDYYYCEQCGEYKIRVGFWIGDNKELFDKLYENKDIIEKNSGLNLRWNRLENKKAALISADILGLDFNNQSNYEELMRKSIDYVVRMRNAIVPFLKALS